MALLLGRRDRARRLVRAARRAVATPRLARHREGRRVGDAPSRFVLGPLARIAQVLSVGLFVLVESAAARRQHVDPYANFAPTWSTSPSGSGSRFSRSCSETSGALCLRGGPSRTRPCGPWSGRAERRARSPTYPEQLGRWPRRRRYWASQPSSLRTPTHRALARSRSRSLSTPTSCSSEWRPSDATPGSARGEGFAVAFSYFAGLAPLTAADGGLRLRWPRHRARETRASARLDRRDLAVLLGSVMFDGYSRTAHWQDLALEGGRAVPWRRSRAPVSSSSLE